MVYLIEKMSMRNNAVRHQYVIVPAQHRNQGRYVGEFPSIADAYQAAAQRGNGLVYLHAATDFPFRIRGPDDTRDETWFRR